MLIEFLQYCTTPAPAYVRKMGYLHGAVAIEARYRRHSQAWQPHLKKCKNLIEQTCQSLQSKRKVVVLGSGGLHDIPLSFLAETFEEVVLIDIVHLRRAKRHARQFPNVVVKQCDVTCLTKSFMAWVKSDALSIPVPTPKIVDAENADLVISLNLMSQLPLPFVAYAEQRRKKALPENFVDALVNNHVTWLRGLTGKSLLITDVQRQYQTNEHLEQEAAIPEMGLGPAIETWDWEIAPKGEAGRGLTITHKVGVFIL